MTDIKTNREKMKRKLLITASTFPRWKDDTEPRFILDYAQAMTEYYDVTVLAPMSPGAAEQEDIDDVHVIRYHYFPVHRAETLCYPGAIVPRIKEKKVRIFLVIPLLIALRCRLKQMVSEYDFVHVNWLIPQGIMQAGITETPFIVTGHGGDISSLNIWPFSFLKHKCLKEAQRVVCVSPYKQAELKRYYPDIESSIISMGVNLETFNKDNNYDKEVLLGLSNASLTSDTKKTVLFVGRLAQIKGVTYLIDAIKNNSDIRLIIAGDGPERNALERQALNSKAEIIFKGSQPHDVLRKYYASADALVVPSIVDDRGAEEGLPTVIFEAMASQLPVVATRTGGIPGLIKDGVNGILVDQSSSTQLNEAIERVLLDNDLRRTLIEGALDTITDYSYTNIAHKYMDILESI